MCFSCKLVLTVTPKLQMFWAKSTKIISGMPAMTLVKAGKWSTKVYEGMFNETVWCRKIAMQLSFESWSVHNMVNFQAFWHLKDGLWLDIVFKIWFQNGRISRKRTLLRWKFNFPKFSLWISAVHQRVWHHCNLKASWKVILLHIVGYTTL